MALAADGRDENKCQTACVLQNSLKTDYGLLLRLWWL